MKNVLFLAPTEGNGGIVSWTKNILANFNNADYRLINIGVSKRRSRVKDANKLNGLLRTLSRRKRLVQEAER